MLERIMVMAVAFGGVLLSDGIALKNKMSKGEKNAYFILLLYGLYTGFDYVINKNWLDYYDVILPVFGEVSKAIDHFLNVKK